MFFTIGKKKEGKKGRKMKIVVFPYLVVNVGKKCALFGIAIDQLA